jgi:hypothetical protein
MFGGDRQTVAPAFVERARTHFSEHFLALDRTSTFAGKGSVERDDREPDSTSRHDALEEKSDAVRSSITSLNVE